MTKWLLDADGNVVQTFHYDEMADHATIHSTMDVEPLIERNKKMQTSGDGYTASRSMRHVASIDEVTYQRWLQEAFGDNWMQRPSKDKMEVLKRRVNDPDFRNFRTITVKV